MFQAEVTAERAGEPFLFVLLDGKHARTPGSFGQVPLPRGDNDQASSRAEDAGEFDSIAWSKDHEDDVHGTVSHGKRPPNVPDDVGNLRIHPGSTPEGEFGDVQANGVHWPFLKDGMQVMAGTGPGIEHQRVGAIEELCCKVGHGVGKWRIVPAVKEALPGRNHVRSIGFEHSALAGQEVEVTLLGGVESVAGGAEQTPHLPNAGLEARPAHRTTKHSDGILKHGSNPTGTECPARARDRGRLGSPT